MCQASLRELALFIDPERAPALLTRHEARFGTSDAEASLTALLAAAYPAFEPLVESQPELFAALVREGWQAPRDREELVARLRTTALDGDDGEDARARLRRAVAYEKVRIAARELLPSELGGAAIDVTAREISDLAEAAIEVALLEAVHHASSRFGEARTARGEPSRFVVLGMGKLGGRELNVGSDIDLVYVYDTDDGVRDDAEAPSLHEYWVHVARRLTETLDGVGEEGRIFRTDLRLRPEGSRGPLAISHPAMERYYETFGRVWERAALVRARPSAGSLELGDEVLRDLSSFVYARRVDPSIASEILRVHDRARVELCVDPARDLSHGPGGIREAELFAQTLQLIFGGIEPSLRTPSALEAFARLGASKRIEPSEAAEIDRSYRLLRRIEHRINGRRGCRRTSFRARKWRCKGSRDRWDTRLTRTSTRPFARPGSASARRSARSRRSDRPRPRDGTRCSRASTGRRRTPRSFRRSRPRSGATSVRIWPAIYAGSRDDPTICSA